jgi:hypothetical protein
MHVVTTGDLLLFAVALIAIAFLAGLLLGELVGHPRHRRAGHADEAAAQRQADLDAATELRSEGDR